MNILESCGKGTAGVGRVVLSVGGALGFIL